MPSSGFVFTGQSGCLLPMLIMFNLIFGKLIFGSTRLWLGVEAVLVLLFVIKIHAFARKISAQLRQGSGGVAANGQSGSHRRGKVIDVEGEVVEGKDKEGRSGRFPIF